MKEIYLLLGSNIGDRQAQLNKAVSALSNPSLKVVNTSSIYETAAWGKTDQSAFLNQVVSCQSDLSPLGLLHHCQQVEKELGRERFEIWGPRTIDIDILYYGYEVYNMEDLIVPHPGIAFRGFTLVPLAEIAPGFNHPLLGMNSEQLLDICPDNLEVNLYQSKIKTI